MEQVKPITEEEIQHIADVLLAAARRTGQLTPSDNTKFRLILAIDDLAQKLAAEKRHSTTWRHHARQWRRIARAYYADHKPNPIFGIDFCPCDVCARYRAFAESPEAAARAALALGGKEQK